MANKATASAMQPAAKAATKAGTVTDLLTV
jgi:hypothetical protein